MFDPDADFADYMVAPSKRDLARYPRSQLPHVVSRDYASGASDPWLPDDYSELPNLLRRQAA